MRWLLVSQDTPLDVLGGTELYVRRLSQALLDLGDEVNWTYYSEGNPGVDKIIVQNDNVVYYRISIRNESRTREQLWRVDASGVNEFRNVLRATEPECVLFNGFGPNQSPEHFAAARGSGAHVLMTYHSPGQSCARWDLLYMGREMCSGLIDVNRCTDCTLQRIGVPGFLRSTLARRDTSPLAQLLPYKAQYPFVRRLGLSTYQRRWQEGMAIFDKIVWHAEWVRDLLIRNGISETRLHHLPLPPPKLHINIGEATKRPTSKRNFVFIGRLTDIKGAHVLTEAVRLLPPHERIEVQIIGARGPDDYLHRIERECSKDQRLKLMPPISFDQVFDVMSNADAVVVPSLWPETGPYTVLEALWTGTPVIGSDRAGIHEIVSKWGGGVLFEAGNAMQLARLLSECDFQSIRRDPIPFQVSWREQFHCCLDALVRQMRPGQRCANEI